MFPTLRLEMKYVLKVRRNLTDFSSTIGHAHETHISILDGASVATRHLNSHINYDRGICFNSYQGKKPGYTD